jgi:hypothetical protein
MLSNLSNRNPFGLGPVAVAHPHMGWINCCSLIPFHGGDFLLDFSSPCVFFFLKGQGHDIRTGLTRYSLIGLG